MVKQTNKKMARKKNPNMTSTSLTKKDAAWIRKQKDRMEKRGLGSVITSMINLIKFHKMEGEMK